MLLFNIRWVQIYQNTREVSSLQCPPHFNRHWFTFGYSLLVTQFALKQNFSGDPVHCHLPQFTRAWLFLWRLRQLQLPTTQNSSSFHPPHGSVNNSWGAPQQWVGSSDKLWRASGSPLALLGVKETSTAQLSNTMFPITTKPSYFFHCISGTGVSNTKQRIAVRQSHKGRVFSCIYTLEMQR